MTGSVVYYLKPQYLRKTKFFVETWNFDPKTRFVYLIFEKHGFSIEKCIFKTKI